MMLAVESPAQKILRDIHLDPVRLQLRDLKFMDDNIAEQLRTAFASVQATIVSAAASRAFKEFATIQFASEKVDWLSVAAPSLFRDLKLDTGTADAIAAWAKQAAFARASGLEGNLFESVAAVIDSATANIVDQGPVEATDIIAQPDSDIDAIDAELREWQKWLHAKPLWVQILANFVLHFAIAILVEVAVSEVTRRWLSSSNADEQTRIVYEIHEYNLAPAMDTLRCVGGKGVNVRAEPSKESSVIGQLSAGHAVEVVESRNGFSRIFYRREPAGEIVTGWAASGYLVKVAC